VCALLTGSSDLGSLEFAQINCTPLSKMMFRESSPRNTSFLFRTGILRTVEILWKIHTNKNIKIFVKLLFEARMVQYLDSVKGFAQLG
jgi:hypothetical protein